MVISVIVNFLSQVIFAFLLFLGEIKNELQHIRPKDATFTVYYGSL